MAEHCSEKSRISLTSGQSVTIFSWFAPKTVLFWDNVVANEKLTWDFLHETCNIPAASLRRLQPSIAMWVKHGGVSPAQALQLIAAPGQPWGANALTELRGIVDISHIIQAKFDSVMLRDTGLTYAELQEFGLSTNLMPMLGLTLYGWITLGLTRSDVDAMTDSEIQGIFSMTRNKTLACFSTVSRDEFESQDGTLLE